MPKFSAAHFKEASEVDALIDPLFPKLGQISLVADGEVHHYQVTREALMRLARQIEQQGKYPPAEPGALDSEPLKAAGRVASVCLLPRARSPRNASPACL